jgi:hypothetical protein
MIFRGLWNRDDVGLDNMRCVVLNLAKVHIKSRILLYNPILKKSALLPNG